jgi:hypothetical protein
VTSVGVIVSFHVRGATSVSTNVDCRLRCGARLRRSPGGNASRNSIHSANVTSWRPMK